MSKRRVVLWVVLAALLVLVGAVWHACREEGQHAPAFLHCSSYTSSPAADAPAVGLPEDEVAALLRSNLESKPAPADAEAPASTSGEKQVTEPAPASAPSHTASDDVTSARDSHASVSHADVDVEVHGRRRSKTTFVYAHKGGAAAGSGGGGAVVRGGTGGNAARQDVDREPAGGDRRKAEDSFGSYLPRLSAALSGAWSVRSSGVWAALARWDVRVGLVVVLLVPALGWAAYWTLPHSHGFDGEGGAAEEAAKGGVGVGDDGTGTSDAAAAELVAAATSTSPSGRPGRGVRRNSQLARAVSDSALLGEQHLANAVTPPRPPVRSAGGQFSSTSGSPTDVTLEIIGASSSFELMMQLVRRLRRPDSLRRVLDLVKLQVASAYPLPRTPTTTRTHPIRRADSPPNAATHHPRP